MPRTLFQHPLLRTEDIRVAMFDGLHVSVASLQLMLCSSLDSSAKPSVRPLHLGQEKGLARSELLLPTY